MTFLPHCRRQWRESLPRTCCGVDRREAAREESIAHDFPPPLPEAMEGGGSPRSGETEGAVRPQRATCEFRVVISRPSPRRGEAPDLIRGSARASASAIDVFT